MSDKNEGITLNGPVFGIIMTILLWALIIGFIWANVATEGAVIALICLITGVGVILGLFGFITWWATRDFYRWAARGFKSQGYW